EFTHQPCRFLPARAHRERFEALERPEDLHRGVEHERHVLTARRRLESGMAIGTGLLVHGDDDRMDALPDAAYSRRETPPADLPPPHLGLPIGTTLGFVWRGAGEDMRENPFGDEMPRRSPHRTKRLPQLIDDQRRTATDPSRLRDHGPERVVEIG